MSGWKGLLAVGYRTSGPYRFDTERDPNDVKGKQPRCHGVQAVGANTLGDSGSRSRCLFSLCSVLSGRVPACSVRAGCGCSPTEV